VPKRDYYKEGTKVYKQGRQFLSHVVPAVAKPARTLWNQLIGFLFVCMSIVFVLSGLRTIRQLDGSFGSIFRLVIQAFCVLLLGGYGVSSFLRARKISRG